MKNATAGADWFDLPAPRPHELPELYKQVEALRLRRAMDPKVHAKADPGEKKGIKGLPKFFAVRVWSSPSTLLVHGSLISRYFSSYYLPFSFFQLCFRTRLHTRGLCTPAGRILPLSAPGFCTSPPPHQTSGPSSSPAWLYFPPTSRLGK